MTSENIARLTNDFLINELRMQTDIITPDTELRRDMGLTSVDAVAIASFAEKTFGCPLIMPEIKAIVTLQDLYDYIERNECK